MDEFIRNLSSPAWWVGVVIVGVFINLVSAYAKPVLDRITSHFGDKWKKRSSERQKAYDEEISKLIVNVELRRHYEYRHLSYMLRALIGNVFAVLLVAMKLLQARAPDLSIARGLGMSEETSASIFYLFISVIVFVSFNLYIVANSIATKLSKAKESSEKNVL